MALVDEYVQSATPVGSSRLAQQYLTEVSAATVRNELMGLETEGYARSPHTSAGRVPTTTGYRVFVNTVLLREGLKDANAMTLATMRGLVSGTSISTNANASINTSIGTSISDVFGLEQVEQRSQDVEQRVDRTLAFLSGATGLLSVLWTVRPETSVHHRGLPQLLAQPEFQDARALIPLMRFIEDEAALAHLLQTARRGGRLIVRIGTENEDGCLASYSMVADVYGEERPRGALAVFGPTRMDYRKAIGAVMLASRLLGDWRAQTLDW
ncbi:MAG: hypothetical protein LBL27_04880 [Coriobacteriales bacterium]|jgi:transcriptional regulator of heat shock response|nr:hypothetical protein [Coriobacteriales bacterium]